jgi:hypothetical protein
MKKKGAILTVDFFISLVIFTIIMLSIIWLWGKVRTDIKEYSVRADKREKALRLSEILVANRGKPPYWHLLDISSDEVSVIGLSGKHNHLMREKLEALASSTYSDVKEIMGLGREDFNLTVIKNWSGVQEVEYSIGRTNENASDQLVIRRLALLDNERVEVVLRLSYEI